MAGTIAFAPGSGVLVPVGKIIGIDGPRPTREALDITPLDAAQGCRVYAHGYLDGGEAVVTGFHSLTDPGQAALRAAFATGAAGMACITLNDGTALVFPAIVHACQITVKDGPPLFTAVLRAAGAVVVSAGPPGTMG